MTISVFSSWPTTNQTIVNRTMAHQNGQLNNKHRRTNMQLNNFIICGLAQIWLALGPRWALGSLTWPNLISSNLTYPNLANGILLNCTCDQWGFGKLAFCAIVQLVNDDLVNWPFVQLYNWSIDFCSIDLVQLTMLNCLLFSQPTTGPFLVQAAHFCQTFDLQIGAVWSDHRNAEKLIIINDQEAW